MAQYQGKETGSERLVKIMIVDDDSEVRLIVRKMLEDEGHAVVEASNGKECIEKLNQMPVDLLLMDVMMPGRDGWEVTRQIRRDKSLKSTKIVMLTVRSGESDMAKSFRYAGSDGHLNKPIVKEQLLNTIRWVLDHASENR